MTQKQFAKLKSQLDKILSKIENAALEKGLVITSQEFQTLLTELKRKLLAEWGIALEDYELAELESDSKDIEEDEVIQLGERTKAFSTARKKEFKEKTDELVSDFKNEIQNLSLSFRNEIDDTRKSALTKNDVLNMVKPIILAIPKYDDAKVLKGLTDLSEKIKRVSQKIEGAGIDNIKADLLQIQEDFTDLYDSFGNIKMPHKDEILADIEKINKKKWAETDDKLNLIRQTVSRMIWGLGDDIKYLKANMGSGSVSDDVYGVGWDADTTHAPSKNAVYDKIETLGGAGATKALDNLALVAINTSLISDASITDDLGSATVLWHNLYVENVGATGTRATTGWFTSLESTNVPTINGTALGSIYAAIAQTFYIGTTQVAINRGTGALTLAGITLTTPDCGTPSAIVLTNASGTMTNITLVTPAIGTPTAGVLTSCTGLPIATGVSGLAANVAAFLATPSSANLLAAVTNETGTGLLVFATSPTLTTPILGTPTSGTLTNCTGLPAANVVAGIFVAAMEASDHGAAATDQIINVCYGTGAAPAANTTTEGSLYVTYTA